MLARERWQVATLQVLEEVYAERVRQEAQYGYVNDTHYDGTGPDTCWLLPYTSRPAAAIEADLRADYEHYQGSAGAPTWVHLIREEVAEAFAETNPERLAEELTQVAALCVSWVERIRVRGAKPLPVAS